MCALLCALEGVHLVEIFCHDCASLVVGKSPLGISFGKLRRTAGGCPYTHTKKLGFPRITTLGRVVVVDLVDQSHQSRSAPLKACASTGRARSRPGAGHGAGESDLPQLRTRNARGRSDVTAAKLTATRAETCR